MEVKPETLNYWSRVALAAESAAMVLPLFDAAWPEATAQRRSAVSIAIDLARCSADHRRACEGVKEASSDAGQSAGRAQIPHLYDIEIEDGEMPPAGREKAAIASLAAKAAQLAAKAASDESRSDEAVEAFYFALHAAQQAGREDLALRIVAAASDRTAKERSWWNWNLWK